MTMYNSLVGSSVDNCSEVAKVGVLCRAPQSGWLLFSGFPFHLRSLRASLQCRRFRVFFSIQMFLTYGAIVEIKDQGTGIKRASTATLGSSNAQPPTAA